ncbi:MAG: archaellin/type IV pilin N-terminal domain-containing protein [Candidatus Bathyarchaeia archaeon]
MKKMIMKNKKALSPVVASIILIAVTVAVSIAVAAWMGALTFTFTATEQLQITRVTFDPDNRGEIKIKVINTGTSAVTITEVYVTNATNITTSPSLPVTVSANNATEITLTLDFDWVHGANYEIKLLSSKGNYFMRTETAPTG